MRILQDGEVFDSFVFRNESDWYSHTYFKHYAFRETISYSTFSFSGSVTVEVTKLDTEAEHALVRPQRFGIEPRLEGQTVRFDLDRPGQYSV